MWDHVVKCKETINLRKEFIEDLLLKMIKNKGTVNVNEIISFCEDILVCLENDYKDKHETNQQHVGMIELFRKHVVNDWMEANLSAKKYRCLNMIAAGESAYFYDRC